jgi:hypothetical protein
MTAYVFHIELRFRFLLISIELGFSRLKKRTRVRQRFGFDDVAKNRNRIGISIEEIVATAVITVATSFYLLVSVSNPFSNPPVEENSGFTSTSIGVLGRTLRSSLSDQGQ